MEVICLEDQAFYAFIDKVVERIHEKYGKDEYPEWINGTDAMKMLGVTNKATMQRYRDEARFKFYQDGKVIMYNTASIRKYLDSKSIGNKLWKLMKHCMKRDLAMDI